MIVPAPVMVAAASVSTAAVRTAFAGVLLHFFFGGPSARAQSPLPPLRRIVDRLADFGLVRLRHFRGRWLMRLWPLVFIRLR